MVTDGGVAATAQEHFELGTSEWSSVSDVYEHLIETSTEALNALTKFSGDTIEAIMATEDTTHYFDYGVGQKSEIRPAKRNSLRRHSVAPRQTGCAIA